jgi:soluble lytic murein transglycosylase-like protein
MPSTFEQIQSKNPEFTSIDDPEANIAAGISYDRHL